MAGRKSRDKGYRQTEEEFQCAVIDYAHFNGWKVAHFRKAMRKDGSYVTPVQADGKGFPDLLMVRQGRIVVAELKSMGRKPTLEQRAWLEAFTDTEKVEAYWWRPDDEDWIEIERVLRAFTNTISS